MNKKNYIICVFVLVAVIANKVSGQQTTKPLVINDSLQEYPESFPFDKPFPVRYIPKKHVRINYVGLFKIGKDGCEANFQPLKCIKQEVKLDENFKDKSTKEQRNEWENRFKHQPASESLFYDENDTTTTGVNFLVPALEPSKRYILIFLSKGRVEEIQNVVDLLSTGKVEDETKAENIFKDIQGKYSFETKSLGVKKCASCTIGVDIGTFDEFKDYFDNILKTDVQAITAKQSELNNLEDFASLKEINININNLDQTITKKTIEYSKQCLQCHDTLWQSDWIVKNKFDIITPLLKLKDFDTNISKGIIDVYSNSILLNEKVSTADRLQNLTNSTLSLINLLKILDYYNTILPFNANSFNLYRKELQNAIAILKENMRIVSKIAKKQSDLKDEVNILKHKSDSLQQASPALFHAVSKFDPNTFSYNFETRNSYIIRADFGFLYYANLNGQSSFRGVAPYLGFHINFRPLDTNIPFGTIGNEGVLGHLSFNGGALIGSFKEEGVRDGLIGNTAIFTGIGWAFTDWLRITSGSIWYKKEDANPLKTKTSTAAVPYVSFSIDLRIQDIYKSLISLFPN